jgi:hypothetical protein
MTTMDQSIQRSFKIQKLSLPSPQFHGSTSGTKKGTMEAEFTPAAQQQQFHEVHHNTGLQNDAESADATFS